MQVVILKFVLKAIDTGLSNSRQVTESEFLTPACCFHAVCLYYRTSEKSHSNAASFSVNISSLVFISSSLCLLTVSMTRAISSSMRLSAVVSRANFRRWLCFSRGLFRSESSSGQQTLYNELPVHHSSSTQSLIESSCRTASERGAWNSGCPGGITIPRTLTLQLHQPLLSKSYPGNIFRSWRFIPVLLYFFNSTKDKVLQNTTQVNAYELKETKT